MEIIPSSDWLPRAGKPLIIAGPCSAESEEQLRNVAGVLSQDDRVHLMRAGIWKPRTSPNSFEGMGEKALPWVKTVSEEFDLPFIIEVAKASHVEAALQQGLKHLWIGARTTVNPFSVQEIAEAVRGTDVAVFVKNPLNPDLKLWVGAFERLANVGMKKLVAIHRGFNTYQDHVFRNAPNWELPIELKTKMPELEIIVDPSHIAGKRSLLSEVAQKAFDLALDGLMIETHPDPDRALSDTDQQLALAHFSGFLDGLQMRSNRFDDAVSIDRLERLRTLIDEIDYNLMENLRKRINIVDEIGKYKADSGVAIFQLERWMEILRDRERYANELNLHPKMIKELWKIIHNESIRLQTEIVQRHKTEKDNLDA